jgi:hypothetical protein
VLDFVLAVPCDPVWADPSRFDFVPVCDLVPLEVFDFVLLLVRDLASLAVFGFESFDVAWPNASGAVQIKASASKGHKERQSRRPAFLRLWSCDRENTWMNRWDCHTGMS